MSVLRAYWFTAPSGKDFQVWLDPALVDPPLLPGEVEIDLSDPTVPSGRVPSIPDLLAIQELTARGTR